MRLRSRLLVLAVLALLFVGSLTVLTGARRPGSLAQDFGADSADGPLDGPFQHNAPQAPAALEPSDDGKATSSSSSSSSSSSNSNSSRLSGHLVLVPGHAVFVGSDFTHSMDESAWFLEPFQRGQAATFVQHIGCAINQTLLDQDAQLVFSGGQTRSKAVQLSEAQSYWLVAHAMGWMRGIEDRVTTEEFATDSFDNLLFSICRFKEATGSYPAKVTVVGFEFKRARFESLHRQAIGYPASRFAYIGIDPPADREGDAQRRAGEMEHSFKPFTKDMYACDPHGPLRAKKTSRNPFHRQHPYAVSCPELQPLLQYCAANRLGPGWDRIYSGALPWK
ncbi:hypothetical protein BC831DRAFT_403657 [Entophlyctis helioformis]|nr:hypothetical protein BC831DRAFT_403657 [Entophlyctis helioformis]